MRSEKRTKKGFTLTEMLILVLIVSVLTAIAYPLYTRTVTKARAVEAINLLAMVRSKQLLKFARNKQYYTNVSGLGQLTSDATQETVNGQVLHINDYTISLNSVKNCATATYNKGNTTFSFSSGYETAGLGCTGSICTSFGNILGTAQEVCNCGSKTCSNGYTLDTNTCNCICNLGCDVSGSCFAPYGGASTRPCASGCGTETSSSSCNGAIWSGTCWTPAQNQPTTQSCGNSGTQTRTCTPSCGGGTCSAWGACTGQTCPSSTKPASSEACGNCNKGNRTRSVTCSSDGTWQTGAWGACAGGGECSPGAQRVLSCPSGPSGAERCSDTCDWYIRKPCMNTNECVGMQIQSCGNCGSQTRTCDTSTGQWSDWGDCQNQGVCSPDSTQTCNGTGTKTCSSYCYWGACSVINCDETNKPATSQACGNCNMGTQTRTVSCNTSDGTWTTGSWENCTGGGVCSPGATQACGGTGTKICTNSCAWDTNCKCPFGSVLNNNICGCPSGYIQISSFINGTTYGPHNAQHDCVLTSTDSLIKLRSCHSGTWGNWTTSPYRNKGCTCGYVNMNSSECCSCDPNFPNDYVRPGCVPVTTAC